MKMQLLHLVQNRDGEPTDAHLPDADAYLDSQRVAIAPGVTLELRTFVPEQIDWESFPFGKLLSQEEQALA